MSYPLCIVDMICSYDVETACILHPKIPLRYNLKETIIHCIETTNFQGDRHGHIHDIFDTRTWDIADLYTFTEVSIRNASIYLTRLFLTHIQSLIQKNAWKNWNNFCCEQLVYCLRHNLTDIFRLILTYDIDITWNNYHLFDVAVQEQNHLLLQLLLDYKF
jgi:hypothetical protein